MTRNASQTALMRYLKKKDVSYYARASELRDIVTDWLSYVPQTFPHYTRHTVKHSDEIVLQLSKLLFRDEKDPARPVVKLSPTEAYILVASAYLHDAGMVASDDEKTKILASDEWKSWTSGVGAGAKRWAEIASLRKGTCHPDEAVRNFLADVQTRFLVADFIRPKHHMRVADVIQQHQALLARFDFGDSLLRNAVSNVCVAHGVSREVLLDNGRYPEICDIRNDRVNLRFAAILLRIGDLLDMSNDRACPLLLNAACPLPEGSIAHWTQYQQITKRLTTYNRIEITAECRDPDEHQFLQKWCQWLVDEVRDARNIMAFAERHDDWKPPKVTFGEPAATITIGPAPTASYVIPRPNLRTIRVFIGSPSGLNDERKLFFDTVKELNDAELSSKDLALVPLGWEDTFPGKERPQTGIAEDVLRSDLVVLLLGERWDSPTEGPLSRFEETYELARSNRKDVWLYFRVIPDAMLADPGEQLRRVLAFRDRIETERRYPTRTYEDLPSWRSRLIEDFRGWLDDQPPSGGGGQGQDLPPFGPNGKPEYRQQIEFLEKEIKTLKLRFGAVADDLAKEAAQLAGDGHPTKAEEHYAKALALGMSPRILNEYGVFLARVGILGKAESKFTELVKTGEILGNEAMRAIGYGNLGVLYQTKGNLATAEEMHRKALVINEELGHKEGMAKSYGNLGVLYQIRGDLATAEEMHRKSLAIHEELGRREGMANQYGNLGILYQTRGDLARSEAMYRKSLAIHEELGRREGMAKSYGNLGTLCRIRGDLAAAEQMYRKALAIDEHLGHKEGIANQCGNLGTLYQIRGDLATAEEMYRKSLAIHEELGRREGMANQYGNLGSVYQIRGDLAAAEQMYRKALAIDEHLGHKEGIANQCGNLGVLYQTKGNLATAEAMQRKALTVRDELGHKEGMANDYLNLGAVYQARGDLAAAEEIYEKALAIDRELGRKEGIASDYSRLGTLCQIRGDLATAEAMHRKALAINMELDRKEGLASDYGNLGIVYRTKGDLVTAEEMYKKSLAIDHELGHREGLAKSYLHLGAIYQSKGDLVTAEEMYREALSICTPIGNNAMIATIRRSLESLKVHGGRD